MKTDKPFFGSGKTHFNKMKRKGIPPTKENPKGEEGESWVKLRDSTRRKAAEVEKSSDKPSDPTV